MPADPVAQLALPFSPDRSDAVEDFVPGAANAEARAWLDRWPDWPGRRLVLSGPPAAGKSHLAAIWRRRAGARLVCGKALAAMPPEAAVAAFPAGSAILVEDADSAPQGRALLHLLNAAAEAGGSVLLTARTPPARWQTTLPDLRSRLAATATARIATPDPALLEAVLAKLMADRQVRVPPRLLAALALRLPRDFAAAHALAAALDAAALASGRRLTRPIAAAALDRALAGAGRRAEPPDTPRDDTSVEQGRDPSPGGLPLR
jgi:chromosomal replication initiation ATPase DnaA